MTDDLLERVTQFHLRELPGQPHMIHTGTSYLVNDLVLEIKRLRAEVERLREQLGQVRVCVNCGKYVPASHERWKELPECVDPESGLSACTFNTTPAEAIEHFRQRAEKAERENAALYEWKERAGQMDREKTVRIVDLEAERDEAVARAKTNAILKAALREVYEVYAGSEGIPAPMTATEGYLLGLVKEMAKISGRAAIRAMRSQP